MQAPTFTINDWFKVQTMLNNGSDYVLCEDGKHAVLNGHNGMIYCTVINESADIDSWEIIGSHEVK